VFLINRPLTSVVEVFKTGKARLIVTLKGSRDEKIRKAGVVRTGRKWSASKAVTEAESRLRYKDVVGTVFVSRHGQRWKGANATERRQLVQEQGRDQESKIRGGGKSGSMD